MDFGLTGMRKDSQGITRDWQLLGQDLLEGVHVQSVNNVMTGYGVLTEIFRQDWGTDGKGVGQVFQSLLGRGAISGWHAHAETTDRLFAASGRIRVVLYDGRKNSRTWGQVNEFRIGVERPSLIVVPPGVWHAVENTGDASAILINVVDIAYRYESPDHYRVPLETPEIPYRFPRKSSDALGGISATEQG